MGMYCNISPTIQLQLYSNCILGMPEVLVSPLQYNLCMVCTAVRMYVCFPLVHLRITQLLEHAMRHDGKQAVHKC